MQDTYTLVHVRYHINAQKQTNSAYQVSIANMMLSDPWIRLCIEYTVQSSTVSESKVWFQVTTAGFGLAIHDHITRKCFHQGYNKKCFPSNYGTYVVTIRAQHLLNKCPLYMKSELDGMYFEHLHLLLVT